MVTSGRPIESGREVAVEWQAIRAISGTGENNSSKRAPSSGALEHQPNQACAPHLLPAKGHRDHPARPAAAVSLLGEHRVELGVQVVVGFTGLQPQRHPVPGSVLLQAARRGEQLPVVLSRPTAGSEAKLVRACGKSDLLVDDAPSEAVERLGAVDVDPAAPIRCPRKPWTGRVLTAVRAPKANGELELYPAILPPPDLSGVDLANFVDNQFARRAIGQ